MQNLFCSKNEPKNYLSNIQIPSIYSQKVYDQQLNGRYSLSNNSSSINPSKGEKDSISLSTGSETKLLRVVHSTYKQWAYFIVNHSWKLIAFCTLITTICTVKVATTPHKNDITGYTPYGARSRDELAIREQFFGQHESGPAFGSFVLVIPKNGNNLLDIDLLAEVVKIDDLIRNNITMFNHVTNRNESFSQFCEDFCDLNEPIRNFYNGYLVQFNRSINNEPLYSKIDLRYPISKIFGRKFSIQPNFYGLEFKKDKTDDEITNIKSIGMVALVYRAERVGQWTDDDVKEYEMSISRFVENTYKSDKLSAMTVSTTYIEVEVVRAGLSMLPFLVFGFLIMATCSSVTVMLSAIYMEQVSLYKIILAVMACVCPFMACGTALGVLFFCGVRFGSVLCVTPFLVLAIGVDDAYLMIHSWQRVTKQMRRMPCKEDCVAYRLSLVLIDTGPAILISALTNIAADAVGSFTGSPEITLLCAGNMASIFVDFIYQITFYSSIIAIIGFYEMRDEANRSYKLSIPINASCLSVDQIPGVSFDPNGGHRDSSLTVKESFHDVVEKTFENFVTNYVRFITNHFVATITCLLWLIFFVVSLVGISRFEVNLSTKKLFSTDSPLLIIDHYREEQIVPFYTLATIFVNNPGDFLEKNRSERLMSMVTDLEKMPESWGSESTNFFLRDFLHFEEDGEEEKLIEFEENNGNTLNLTNSLKLSNNNNLDINDLKSFLKWPEYNFWRGFLHFDKTKNETAVSSFFFTTAYHGNKLRNWVERMRLFQKWRTIVDAYPEFNASIYHDEGLYMDLIDNMPTDMWQSTLATLLCMGTICFIFMYNVYTVFVASAVIASIIVGMLGLLSWQGVSMDPIMMAALIISIGFSVDIPAHVSYHYHSSAFESTDSLSVRDRLKTTFASVGFPALQASLSTSLCVLSLLFVKLYMAKIFVQIMCLCLIMCIVHSLIILPAVFSLIEMIQNKLSPADRRSNNKSKTNSIPQNLFVQQSTHQIDYKPRGLLRTNGYMEY